MKHRVEQIGGAPASFDQQHQAFYQSISFLPAPAFDQHFFTVQHRGAAAGSTWASKESTVLIDQQREVGALWIVGSLLSLLRGNFPIIVMCRSSVTQSFYTTTFILTRTGSINLLKEFGCVPNKVYSLQYLPSVCHCFGRYLRLLQQRNRKGITYIYLYIHISTPTW